MQCIPDVGTSQRDAFLCHVCKKQYKSRAGLYKHKREQHSISTKNSINCSIPNCGCTFRLLHQYRTHLQTKHEVEMLTFKMEFKNIPGKNHALESKTFHLYVLIADFKEWKVRFERDTNSSFVKTTGEKWSSNKILTYYYCNRSGYFRPSGNKLRALKSQITVE